MQEEERPFSEPKPYITIHRLFLLLLALILILIIARITYVVVNVETVEELDELVYGAMQAWLVDWVSPYTFAGLGIASALGFSVLGAGWYAIMIYIYTFSMPI